MSEITQALKPFSTFAEHAVENVDGTWVWKNSQNERICDWFGPSDFGAAFSCAAVAKREPVAFPECVLGLIDGKITLAFETPDDAQTAFDIIERTISDPANSELEAENARLRKDAERWRALLRCARIRMFGSAGFNPETGEREQYSNATKKMEKSTEGWVHFGAEFWSVYPGVENYDGTNQWGIHALTALADDVSLKAALSTLPQGADHE